MLVYNNLPDVKLKKNSYYIVNIGKYNMDGDALKRKKLYRQSEHYKALTKEYLKKYAHTDKRKQYMRQYFKGWNQTLNGKTSKHKNQMMRRMFEDSIIEAYTESEWQNKLLETNGICPCCDKYIGIDKLTRDHNPAVSKANELYKQTGNKTIYTINDMIPLCKSCNSSKGNRFILREVAC
jgi:5-methylcytosine-specific restriction endonuclease McrA